MLFRRTIQHLLSLSLHKQQFSGLKSKCCNGSVLRVAISQLFHISVHAGIPPQIDPLARISSRRLSVFWKISFIDEIEAHIFQDIIVFKKILLTWLPNIKYSSLYAIFLATMLSFSASCDLRLVIQRVMTTLTFGQTNQVPLSGIFVFFDAFDYGSTTSRASCSLLTLCQDFSTPSKKRKVLLITEDRFSLNIRFGISEFSSLIEHPTSFRLYAFLGVKCSFWASSVR